MAVVTCTRCRITREGAGRVLPGAIGDQIEAGICAECWTEWLGAQIRVINHNGLRPVMREDREKLYAFTREFLGLPA